jgi:hypothetical protein
MLFYVKLVRHGKINITWPQIYMESKNAKTIEAENRMVIT